MAKVQDASVILFIRKLQSSMGTLTVALLFFAGVIKFAGFSTCKPLVSLFLRVIAVGKLRLCYSGMYQHCKCFRSI